MSDDKRHRVDSDFGNSAHSNAELLRLALELKQRLDSEAAQAKTGRSGATDRATRRQEQLSRRLEALNRELNARGIGAPPWWAERLFPESSNAEADQSPELTNRVNNHLLEETLRLLLDASIEIAKANTSTKEIDDDLANLIESYRRSLRDSHGTD